jgi:predicted ATPase
MNDSFVISGFKCFKNASFDLKEITALTGNNGTGKSTVIQALLLIRLAIEKNVFSFDDDDYLEKKWKGVPVPINLGYELALGSIFDIFNEEQLQNNKITFGIGQEEFEILIPDEDADRTSAFVQITRMEFNSENVPFWRKREFYYLSAERLGPRYSLSSNFTEFAHCGFQGEFTAQVLLNNDFFKVASSRLFPKSKSENLPIQVDQWLNYICPGTSVRVESLGLMSAQIRLRNNIGKKEVLATNIGFGISYCLPIIVTGLIAEIGSAFVVENPEAHLHPKGQSNIGYFLGVIAASGVKVIVETHSEHVVNGIRRAFFDYNKNSEEFFNIYFFGYQSQSGERLSPISLNSSGDFSLFPKDFFDQVQQDMAEIYRAQKKRNG